MIANSSLSFQGQGALLLLLSALFWGPVIHAIGLAMLVVCGFRSRWASSNFDTVPAPSSFAGIGVRLNQSTCAITGHTGVYSIIASSVFRQPVPFTAIGAFQIGCFLVDVLVLGSMVRFRFLYIWIAMALYGLSAIADAVILLKLLFSRLPSGAGPRDRDVSEIVGFAFLRLLGVQITGLVQKLLTRSVLKCCLKGKQSEEAAADIEEQSESALAFCCRVKRNAQFEHDQKKRRQFEASSTG